MGLEITVSEGASVRIIAAMGEVDLSTSPQLREAILEGIKSKHAVGVDLSAVEYMDSSGVATLVEGVKSCAEKQQTFVLIQPSDSVMKVLQLSRLDRLFDIRETLETT